MGNMQVYYFTKTGRSEAIAKSLADKYGTEANRITDEENWGGVVGFIKGGAKASKKESTKANYRLVEAGKDIVLVFPIWAGKFPPAVNSFMEGIDRSRVTLIATSMKSVLKDRTGYKKVIDLAGKDITAEGIEL